MIRSTGILFRLRHTFFSVGAPAVFIAFAVGGVAIFEVHSLLKSQELPKQRLLIARRALRAGSAVTLRDFSFEWGSAEGYLTDQDLPLLQGATLMEDLAAGHRISTQQLKWESRRLSDQLKPGTRAYVIKLKESPSVMRGDRIDVFVSPGWKRDTPELVVENVGVMRVGGRGSDVALTIGVSVEQIRQLEKIKETGKLVIALRNSEDNASNQNHLKKTAVKARSVQVITEGKGDRED